MKLAIQCFVVFAALLFASALPLSSSARADFIEPKCGKLGCCYYTHGFCAKCCEPEDFGFGGFGGGQGGDPGYGGRRGGYGGDDSGYVEPKCEWGCCESYMARCVACCPSPWIPPIEVKKVGLSVSERN